MDALSIGSTNGNATAIGVASVARGVTPSA